MIMLAMDGQMTAEMPLFAFVSARVLLCRRLHASEYVCFVHVCSPECIGLWSPWRRFPLTDRSLMRMETLSIYQAGGEKTNHYIKAISSGMEFMTCVAPIPVD